MPSNPATEKHTTTDCWTLSPAWRHVVTEPLLPVQHGDEITMTCSTGLILEGENIATCNDGALVPESDKAPWCLSKLDKMMKPPFSVASRGYSY